MLEILNKYYEDGWLIKQTHLTLPLTIWNYSQTTQYAGHWDEVTLQCRGLITDNIGNVLVRPFPKFFNYEEVVNSTSDQQIPVKGDYVYVQEKMDGSLGILFNYEGEWVMATRGSFTSDQAIKGMEILKRNYPVFDRAWLKEYAYLVEIIYPENRIVVDYEKEKIVFLSAVLNEGYSCWASTSETELYWTTACSIFAANGIKKSDIVKTEQHFNFSDELYRSLKKKNETNKEGFVLRFFPGNFRMKIKFEEYVRLHRIMTGVSTTSIWDVLSTGGDMEGLLKDVPDEFYSKIKEYETTLIGKFNIIKSRYELIFQTINRVDRVKDNIDSASKKAFAEKAKRYTYSSILFAMLSGKNPSPIIWKIIKPEWRKL